MTDSFLFHCSPGRLEDPAMKASHHPGFFSGERPQKPQWQEAEMGRR